MSHFTFRRLIAIFALIAVLGAPLSSSAAPRTGDQPAETRLTVPASLSWLSSLAAAAWTSAGWPSRSLGRYRVIPQHTPAGDDGVSSGPIRTLGKAGNSIDPYGRCSQGPC